MAGKKILIIGGVACGPKAAARARRRDPEAEITIIEKGGYISYAGCGMPFYLAGTVPKLDGLMATPYGEIRTREFFAGRSAINVRTATLAESIDPAAKTVAVRDLATNAVESLPYDQLVLATGASPVKPPIPGIDLKNVFTMHHPDDAKTVLAFINESGAETVVIMGGGLIGLETADAMNAQAVDVTIVEMMPTILSRLLDGEMARNLEKKLRAEKAIIMTGAKALEFKAGEGGKVAAVVLDNGEEIETDFVVVAAGVRPNVELAKATGLAIGPSGAIAVDEFLRTSDPHIFAGGDCAENTHIVSGAKVFAPMGSTANRHGRIIGDNVTGGASKFPGITGTAVLKVLGVNVGRTGLTEDDARAHGFDPVVCMSPSVDRAHFYPGGMPILIKLVGDRATGRLLGGQIIGRGDMSKRIDVLASALFMRATMEDLANFDLGYAPPFSTALDAVTHSSNIVRNKIDGTAEAVSVAELKEMIVAGADFKIIDVRTPHECEARRVPGENVLEIPLNQLRDKAAGLGKDVKYVIMCQGGARSYEAQRILLGFGFRSAAFLDGGLSALPEDFF